jgi:membrane fusion protein, heavy metal efflux system
MNTQSQEPQPIALTAVAKRSFVQRILGSIPTLLMFALLGLVAFWGHRTGWTMPKLSALMNTEAVVVSDDWCAEHSVPESACVECHEELFPRVKPHGWCRVHGVSECPTCHPELVQIRTTPKTLDYDSEPALAQFPRERNNEKCKLPHRRIQFASVDAVKKAGVEVDIVAERAMMEAITAYGEVIYDPSTVIRLSSRTSGTVRKVYKTVGDTVQAGDVIALIDSAEVGKAKTEYATAVVQLQLKTRNLSGLNSAGSAEKALREAEAMVEETRLRVLTGEQSLANLGLVPPAGLDRLDGKEVMSRLKYLGLPQKLLDSVAAEIPSANLLPVKAVQAGQIVSTDVVSGEVIDSTRILFTTADVSKMRLSLNVRQEDVKYVAIGQATRFRADSGGVELTGTVSWIGTAVDHKTRTIPVRVDVPNQDGQLRANTFGTGKIQLRNEPQAICVPIASVQWEGCCHVVFVRDRNYLSPDSPKVFHVRQVRIGAKDETHVELLAGVRPGELVVYEGASVLKGELLRGNLGEGCGCCH